MIAICYFANSERFKRLTILMILVSMMFFDSVHAKNIISTTSNMPTHIMDNITETTASYYPGYNATTTETQNTSSTTDDGSSITNKIVIIRDGVEIYEPQYSVVVIVLIVCLSALGIIYLMGPDDRRRSTKRPRHKSSPVKPWTRDEHNRTKKKAATAAVAATAAAASPIAATNPQNLSPKRKTAGAGKASKNGPTLPSNATPKVKHSKMTVSVKTANAASLTRIGVHSKTQTMQKSSHKVVVKQPSSSKQKSKK